MRSWIDQSGEVVWEPAPSLIEQLVEAGQFGQRAKLQVYGNGVMLVGFGLDKQLRQPVEVHCYYTTGFLITLRRVASPALDALRQAGSVQPQRVLHQAGDQELAEITVIGRRAAVTRRIVTPGRDLAARAPLIQSLPGATSETQLYAEDINDELGVGLSAACVLVIVYMLNRRGWK
jgi:magnesium transporter